MKTYFQIPHSDKDDAKACGARWDKEVELWFGEDPDVVQTLAGRWPQAEPLLPVSEFPGEDRGFGQTPKLGVELVPSTCWLTTIRSCVSKQDWKRIEMGLRQRAGKACEICAARPGDGVFLETQARFSYDDGVQALRRLMCVCTHCQNAMNFGQSQLLGHHAEVRTQLAAVNGWSQTEVHKHIQESFVRWAQRSTMDFAVDLSLISAAGIELALPPEEKRRKLCVKLGDIRSQDMTYEELLALLVKPEPLEL